MKRTKYLSLVTVIIIILNIFICNKSYAETKTNDELSLYSEAAILLETSTGKILAEKNSNSQMYPASTTKILTAIIAIEKCNLSDKVTASRSAIMSIPSGYSNAAIQENEVLTVKELLDVFLVHSANEAGFILAEHISGSIENFAELMNQKATEIGCQNTHFTNPSGIHDNNHYSTAYDMALIAKYCMENEAFRNIVSQSSCTVEPTEKYEKRYFVNTNDLMIKSSKYHYEYAIGIKTGYTSQAKNCLIAASSKDGLELITVVLGAQLTETGASARYVDTIKLFDYGFENFKIQELVPSGTTQQKISIKNATKDTKELNLSISNSITAFMSKDFDISNVQPSIELDENISAPIAQGTVLGKITYNIEGIDYSSDLVASNNVEKSNILILIIQIILAIFVLIILSKLLSWKFFNKRGNSKRYKKNYDSLYKFN